MTCSMGSFCRGRSNEINNTAPPMIKTLLGVMLKEYLTTFIGGLVRRIGKTGFRFADMVLGKNQPIIHSKIHFSRRELSRGVF